MSTLRERQVKPIYGECERIVHVLCVEDTAGLDALEAGSLKAALQACNKLLKKQPHSELVKVHRVSCIPT